MQFIIEDDGSSKKVVYCIGDLGRFDYYSYEMLCENGIEGIVDLQYTERNGMDAIQYDITKYDTLRNYLSFSITLENLLSVFKQIILIVEELESYLLDKSLLITDIGQIFYDRVEDIVKMIYFPVFETTDMITCEERLFVLFREIIFSAKFVVGNDDRYITELLNGISDISDYSIADFKEIVNRLSDKINEGCEKKIYSYSAIEKSDVTYDEKNMLECDADVVEESVSEYGADYNHTGNTGLRSFIRRLFFKGETYENQNKENDFAEEICFANDEESESEIIEERTENNDETIVLMRGNMGTYTPYLIRTLTGEQIAITKRIFRIGKDKRYADYIISDNAAVSRAHAEFMIKDGKIYITDEDSLNGTYINGEKLEGRQEKEAGNGDVILIADEEYVLYC